MLKTITVALAALSMHSPSPIEKAEANCNQRQVVPCIKYAALKHRQSFADMKATAYCESTYNPYAKNGPYRGLYQFDKATWAGGPHPDRSRTSAKHAALSAAWYWKRGERSRWPVCG